jgi:hypothetical protein
MELENNIKNLAANNKLPIEDNLKTLSSENLVKIEDNVKNFGVEDNVKNFSGVEDNVKKIDDDYFKNYTKTVINNSGTGNIIFKKNNTNYDYDDYPKNDYVNFAIDYKITKTKIFLNVMLLIGLFINF